MLFRNSPTFGLSWVPPFCLWHPKNFSIGSWHILRLRKAFTPGTEKRNRTRSTKDLTANGPTYRVYDNQMIGMLFEIFTCHSETKHCLSTKEHSSLFRFSKSWTTLHAFLPVIKIRKEGIFQPLYMHVKHGKFEMHCKKKTTLFLPSGGNHCCCSKGP